MKKIDENKVEQVIDDIAKMGLSVIVSEGSIEVVSKNFHAYIFEKSPLEVQSFIREDKFFMQSEWENLSAEIDNLNRAILWVKQLYRN